MAQVIIEYDEYQRLLKKDIKHVLNIELSKIENRIRMEESLVANVSEIELLNILKQLRMVPLETDRLNVRNGR